MAGRSSPDLYCPESDDEVDVQELPRIPETPEHLLPPQHHPPPAPSRPRRRILGISSPPPSPTHTAPPTMLELSDLCQQHHGLSPVQIGVIQMLIPRGIQSWVGARPTPDQAAAVRIYLTSPEFLHTIKTVLMAFFDFTISEINSATSGPSNPDLLNLIAHELDNCCVNYFLGMGGFVYTLFPTRMYPNISRRNLPDYKRCVYALMHALHLRLNEPAALEMV